MAHRHKHNRRRIRQRLVSSAEASRSGCLQFEERRGRAERRKKGTAGSAIERKQRETTHRRQATSSSSYSKRRTPVSAWPLLRYFRRRRHPVSGSSDRAEIRRGRQYQSVNARAKTSRPLHVVCLSRRLREERRAASARNVSTIRQRSRLLQRRLARRTTPTRLLRLRRLRDSTRKSAGRALRLQRIDVPI